VLRFEIIRKAENLKAVAITDGPKRKFGAAADIALTVRIDSSSADGRIDPEAAVICPALTKPVGHACDRNAVPNIRRFWRVFAVFGIARNGSPQVALLVGLPDVTQEELCISRIS